VDKFDFAYLGVGITPILFVGASNISVPSTGSNGQSSSQNLFGVSYGTGLVWSLKHSFQIGLVGGADRVSSTAKYQYNSKPWVALEIGFSFLN
jgi:hypothetical protein